MLFKEGMITVPVSGKSLTQPDRILDAILQMSNTLAGCKSEQEVLSSGLELVMDFFMLGTGRVYLLDEDGLGLSLAVAVGIDASQLEHMELGEGFSGQAAQNKCFLAQRVDDLEDPDRVERLKGLGLRSVVCLPLIAGDQVFGVMNLGARRIFELNYRTIDGFNILGNMMAVAAKNARTGHELKEAAALLAEQNQAIRFFAYTASHDLKSPATALVGLAARLRKVAAAHMPAKEVAILERIERASALLATLAGEINVYIQAKSGDLATEPVRLGEVLEEIRGEVSEQLKERGITWSDRTGNPTLVASRLGLRRIFQNLVDNALKYGGPKLSTIEIGCNREGGLHRLWVRDNGAGLPFSQSKAVFNLFQRGENKQEAQGSGLGLAIVMELARRHGGTAWADCSPQRGCTFFFTLVAAEEKTPESKPLT